MRARHVVRFAGYRAASGVVTVRHRTRRRLAPDHWTDRDPGRVFWAPPTDIVATTRVRLDESLRGRMLGGDWDQTAIALHTLALWKGLEQRIVERRAWEDTDLAPGRYVIEAPNVGSRLSTGSLEDRSARLHRIDALIRSLRHDGWQPHHRVGARFEREMAVAVTWDGTLVRNSGGLHRTIISQLIGLDRIPYRVLVEHPNRGPH